MQVEVGVGTGAEVGSALVPLSPSGWDLSSSVPCLLTPTIVLITTHLPRLTTRPRPLITRKLGIHIIRKLGILLIRRQGIIRRPVILLIHRRGIHILPHHRWHITRPREAVGIPITNLITLVE
jgi:hypothetical protein